MPRVGELTYLFFMTPGTVFWRDDGCYSLSVVFKGIYLIFFCLMALITSHSCRLMFTLLPHLHYTNRRSLFAMAVETLLGFSGEKGFCFLSKKILEHKIRS